MVFESTVRDNTISIPSELVLPDGTPVRVETIARRTLADLLPLAGSWAGEDAEEVVSAIYAARSSSRLRPLFDE